MRVDHATLSDLAIMDAGEDGVSVFSLLHRTRTRLGAARLRARMRALPPTSDELRATQNAVRFLAANPGKVEAALDALNIDAVDEYLTLRWQAITQRSASARFVERLVLRLQYREAVRQIMIGVERLRGMLDSLPSLVGILESAPAALAHHGRALAALLDHAGAQRLQHLVRGRSLRNALEADRLARGPEREALREILGIVADIDATFALASATMEHGWVFPVLESGDGVVVLEGLRHPALSGAVANDVIMNGRHRVLAVTGPNMAGKSTVLKAMGIALYLAHLGAGVPARSARLSRFDALLASLYLRDSLSAGESFYLSEVRRIKELMMLLDATPRVFAVIDEPFKGTNVLDASEATGLLLDGLCAQTASAVVIATHLAAVVQSRTHDNSLSASFLGAADDEGEAPQFDYQLRAGVSEQRLGMLLLRREGVVTALASAIERRGRAALS